MIWNDRMKGAKWNLPPTIYKNFTTRIRISGVDAHGITQRPNGVNGKGMKTWDRKIIKNQGFPRFPKVSLPKLTKESPDSTGDSPALDLVRGVVSPGVHSQCEDPGRGRSSKEHHHAVWCLNCPGWWNYMELVAGSKDIFVREFQTLKKIYPDLQDFSLHKRSIQAIRISAIKIH